MPGTTLRFGWDPILGLIPGLGELVTPLFSLLLFGQAFSVRVPPHVLIRMLANVALDMAAGAVPVLGDLLDVAWKANTRNVDLLERHARAEVRPGFIDRMVVAVVLALLVVVAAVPVIMFAWVVTRFGWL